MPDRDDRRVLTVAEAAEVLRLSEWSVREAIKRGDLRAVRIGGRILVPVAVLDALIDGGVQSAAV